MNFDEIKNKIYPWIKVLFESSTSDAPLTNEIELKEDEQPIMQTWLGDLVIFYVIDEGDSFNVLLKRDLPTNLTVAELHDMAITNLDRDVEFKFNETRFGGHGLIAGGNHEAGSLTLKGIWNWCANDIQDNLIIAVPAKDIIMMVPENDIAKINALKDFVTEIFKDGERLLTKQLFRFDKSNSTWTLWGQVD